MQALLNRMLFFSMILVCVEKVSAQTPVFTDTAYAPWAGDQYTVMTAQYLSPGNAGANQTWNFSAAIQSGTLTYNVTDVAAIGCGSQYPTATLGIGTSGYEMIQRTWNEYNIVGNTVTPGMANFIYSDPEKRFKFPMNFNNSYTDLFYGISNVGPTTYRDGFVLISCDGFGTITTPVGTYTNALRIHRSVLWTDSSQTGMDSCSGDYYYWFAPGNRYPVAQIWSVNCTGGNSMGAEFLQSITIGVDEPAINPAISLFPNPASEVVTVSCNEQQIGDAITLVDLTGRVVMIVAIADTRTEIRIADLEEGIYFVYLPGGASEKLIISNSAE